MNATVQTTGDWFVRDLEPAQKFARFEISDDCADAANRAARMFDPGFPGWQLYSRIYRDDNVFDRMLTAWAVGLARHYVRSRKLNGQPVVRPFARRNAWITQAAADALHCTISGTYPDSAYARAIELDVDEKTYKRVRNVVCGGMVAGMREYVPELHYQLSCVERENRSGNTKYFRRVRPVR